MTEQPNTRYIFWSKDKDGEWDIEAPSWYGFESPKTKQRAKDFFAQLRTDGVTHIRVERLDDDETYTDVSNDIEEAIWQDEQDELREAREGAEHERAERASWRYI